MNLEKSWYFSRASFPVPILRKRADIRLGVGFNPFRSGLALATDSINIVSCCQSRKLNFFLSIKVNIFLVENPGINSN